MGKYVIQWTNRPGSQDEVTGRRLLDVFSKWTPAASNIVQFVNRVDGGGGLSIVETDNPRDILRDVSKFGAWLEFSVIPVVDVQDSIEIFNESLDFLDSIPK